MATIRGPVFVRSRLPRSLDFSMNLVIATDKTRQLYPDIDVSFSRPIANHDSQTTCDSNTKHARTKLKKARAPVAIVRAVGESREQNAWGKRAFRMLRTRSEESSAGTLVPKSWLRADEDPARDSIPPTCVLAPASRCPHSGRRTAPCDNESGGANNLASSAETWRLRENLEVLRRRQKSEYRLLTTSRGCLAAQLNSICRNDLSPHQSGSTVAEMPTTIAVKLPPHNQSRKKFGFRNDSRQGAFPVMR